jgi:hypothetical protein
MKSLRLVFSIALNRFRRIEFFFIVLATMFAPVLVLYAAEWRFIDADKVAADNQTKLLQGEIKLLSVKTATATVDASDIGGEAETTSSLDQRHQALALMSTLRSSQALLAELNALIESEQEIEIVSMQSFSSSPQLSELASLSLLRVSLTFLGSYEAAESLHSALAESESIWDVRSFELGRDNKTRLLIAFELAAVTGNASEIAMSLE